jgi:hypothetical protein
MKPLPEETEEGLKVDGEPKYHNVLRSDENQKDLYLGYYAGIRNDAILGVSYQGK